MRFGSLLWNDAEVPSASQALLLGIGWRNLLERDRFTQPLLNDKPGLSQCSASVPTTTDAGRTTPDCHLLKGFDISWQNITSRIPQRGASKTRGYRATDRREGQASPRTTSARANNPIRLKTVLSEVRRLETTSQH
jgi:hypothetical protein